MRPRKFVRSTALMLVLTAALTVTAFAADPTQQPATKTDNKSSYYPTSVEMTEDDAGNPMIRKTYQLSVSDDPQKLPVADFERDGRRYYLLDMTKEDKIGVDTKEHSEAVQRHQRDGADPPKTGRAEGGHHRGRSYRSSDTGPYQRQGNCGRVWYKETHPPSDAHLSQFVGCRCSSDPQDDPGQWPYPHAGRCPVGQRLPNRSRRSRGALLCYRTVHRRKQQSVCDRLHGHCGLLRQGHKNKNPPAHGRGS